MLRPRLSGLSLVKSRPLGLGPLGVNAEAAIERIETHTKRYVLLSNSHV